MLFVGGAVAGRRILSPLGVARIIGPVDADAASRTSAASDGTWTRATRRTAASCSRSARSGTQGFTGTSLWIDPDTDVFVVFLSNRLHPDGKGDVTPLRARVATIVAAAFTGSPRR